MKKSILTFGAVFILSMILTACNTDIDEPTSTVANEQQPENEQVQNNEQENTATEQPEDSKQEKIEQNEETKGTLTYTSNGQLFTEEVVTSTSEEMDYTIQHFENYTLVAEEPGIDQLMYNDDNALSMQIEVVKKEDVTFEQMKTAAHDTISAIAPEGFKELDLSAIMTNRDEILNIVGYEAELDGEKVVKVVTERDNLFATLTIYDTPQADLTDAFLQMGLTIQ